ncbi:hypothetical protein CBS101457_001919 [Exobasidium rhododendri]|nr:hypothetical protein CBS101457_001919 [Exobasidium rhododendri]
MQLINTVALSAIVLSGFAAAQTTFSVATPSSLVQCQPYLITWTGGVAPYFPRITQPGNTASIIENFAQTSSMSYSWTVDQAVGQTVTIVIGDSTGATAASAISPSVAAGSSSSCLTASASSSQASSSTSAASSSSSSSSAAASSSSSSSRATSSSTTAAAATSSTAAATSSTAAAATSKTSSAAAAATTTAAAHNSVANLRGFAAVVAGSVGVVVAALL